MSDSQIKRVVVEMIQSGEIKFHTAGNPNVGTSLYIEIDVNEEDFYCNETIKAVDL